MKRSIKIPDTLQGAAVIEWKRLTKELGDLTPSDRAILTIYCEQYRIWAEAVAALATDGTVVKLPNGWPGPNPYLAIVTKSTSQMSRLLAQLGATPQSRKKKSEAQAEPEEKELEY